ncbi:integrin alpha-8-like isoform X2 [Tubulanus polymorphus]|uniref:integrin alpha-8-like isoform X2 n=1 Tax=Tubulanus polymorphus TaxID=672921 RepID=UPI003DA2AA21
MDSSLFALVCQYLVVICWIFAGLTGSFNVDLRTAFVHKGKPGSMFGFSVAEHNDQNVKWVLIGAPRAQTRQASVTKAGAVYRCKPDDPRCGIVPFDTKGPDTTWNGTMYVPSEDKSFQWFGATLSASENGVIVACAPRYVYFTRFLDSREPVGTCFVAMGSTTRFPEYSPCRTGYGTYDEQGHCQAGFSATLSKDGRTLLIGAVGSWFWQGQLFSNNLLEVSKQHLETREGHYSEDYSYQGYSTGIGEFTFDDKPDYVAGVPRADGLLGRVMIYDHNMEYLHNITGEQFGAYFGYSMAVVDLNGDGADDIIVGAPFYSSYKSENYDTGRVFIYYQNPRGSPQRFSTDNYHYIDGFGHKSRFGQALTKLNDINSDGIADLAVTAPYEDEQGVVYIYHGSIDGIIREPSQVIKANDVSPGLKTFGFSISGGIDLDDNHYPDLLIGAYESDKAVVLRSRPIIKLNPTMNFIPDVIDLDDADCDIGNGRKVTCLTLRTCLLYGGIGVPDQIELELDHLNSDAPRALFINTELNPHRINISAQLNKASLWCREDIVYLSKTIRDKLTPLSSSLKYRLVEKSNPKPKELLPILDQFQSGTRNLLVSQARFKTNCGPDNICIPDLVVKTKKITKFHTIGSKDAIEFVTTILNKLEDAYEATVYIKLPPGVGYFNIDTKEKKSGVSCGLSSINNSSYVVCSVGNPLIGQSKSQFTVTMTTSQLTATVDSLKFELNVNSTNAENISTSADNAVILHIPIRVVAQIQLTGVSNPEQLVFNITDAAEFVKLPAKYLRERDVGPEVTHLYQLKNIGPSSISRADVEILWPSIISENNEHLLYLVEMPKVIKGEGHCVAEYVNPEDIKLQYREDGDVKYLPVIEGKATSTAAATTAPAKRREKRSTKQREKRFLTTKKRNYFKKFVCESRWCSVIRCNIGRMDKSDSVLIQLRSRLWLHTLMMNELYDVVIQSEGVAQVMDVPYDIKPISYSIDTFQVSTYATAGNMTTDDYRVPLWVIALGVALGLLALILISIMLWKCGFFKRQKAENLDNTDMMPPPHKADLYHYTDHDGSEV